MCRRVKYFESRTTSRSFAGSAGCTKKNPRLNLFCAPFTIEPKRKTTPAKSATTTDVRRRKRYSRRLETKNTATAMPIHTICLSKYASSTENERIVTSPRSEMASAAAKRNQSMWENERILVSAACFRCEIMTLLVLYCDWQWRHERDDIHPSDR